MYRFLRTPRWLGLAAAAVAAAAVMVLLGNWQLDRYRERSATNDRIAAAARSAPVPLAEVVPAPTGPAGTAGPAPAEAAQWRRVTVSGRFDPANEIIVRGRTVQSRVGFEIVTPLVLADGSAVLVDRGWLPPPAGGGATAQPSVPPPPAGLVTVVGRIHHSESRPGAITRRDGRIEVRRVAVAQLATALPHRVYGAYLLLDSPAQPEFTAVPSRRENAWQNGGYAVQWWIFAALALVGFGWLVRREARGPGAAGPAAPAVPAPARRPTSTPTG